VPADQLCIFLREFLVDAARGLRHGIFGSSAFGKLAAAEIILSFVIEHS
jgi:1,2-phenylacetyl-CoA epoxidase catalytic subunit